MVYLQLTAASSSRTDVIVCILGMTLDVFHVHGSYFTIVDHFMGQSELLYVYPISNNAASERFISAWHDA